MILLEKEYNSESIIDLESDLYEVLEDNQIPKDEYGLELGTFKVVITWVPEEAEDD